jgi:hypothetical protein
VRRRIFEASFWDLIDSFFSAVREFAEIHELYERRVLYHAEAQGVERQWLRLEADAVSKLLDFERLAALRNGSLYRTKEVSHTLFRSKGRTHKFDRYISEIFHDLSILREEQYKVSTFAEEYRLANEMEEYESLLDEVHEDFPRRVHGIQVLFQKAQVELERALRAHRTDPLYLRSLCLFGDQLFGELRMSYPQGKLSHCWQVFENGPADSLLWAARSFAKGGFKPQALRVVDEALKAADAPPPYGFGDEASLAAVRAEIVETKKRIESHSPLELTSLPFDIAPMHRGDDSAPDTDEDDPLEDVSDELATWAG